MKKFISCVTSLVLAVVIMVPSVSVFAASFKGATFTMDSKEYVYTGEEIRPSVIVTVPNTSITPTDNTTVDLNQTSPQPDVVQLVEGVDYNLVYSGNTKIGIATVVVKGIGNYDTRQKSINFRILPPVVNNIEVTETTSSSVSLKWDQIDKASGVNGYIVYSCDNLGENKHKVATTKSNSITINKLKVATDYNYYVVAYRQISEDRKLVSEKSAIVYACTIPNQAYVNSVTNSKKKSTIKVSWEQRDCTGYQIMYSTNSNFKNAKTVNVNGEKKLSKTIKVPSVSKTYFVKVRAYKIDANGEYQYGKWSDYLTNQFSKVYSKYSSYYVNNKDRTTNLKLACKKIDGTILQPGETFSFNGTVGERTKSKGFKPAHVFAGSTETVMGVGGGVCQVASTMFNAALLGNFQIVERHQHSQRVTYVPLGRDSAIYWGAQDFKFKNNTKQPIKICMACKDGLISCTIKVSEDVKPKKVSLNVSSSGNKFTLKRSVGGKINYTTSSRY